MSSETSVVWPNIGIVRGRLFGLGHPVPLPAGTQALDAAGNSTTLNWGQARLLQPCVAMTPEDCDWLSDQAALGALPAIVASNLVFLPAAVAEL